MNTRESRQMETATKHLVPPFTSAVRALSLSLDVLRQVQAFARRLGTPCYFLR